MVERELQATWLYASTGLTVLPVSEQREDVSSPISSSLDKKQRKKPKLVKLAIKNKVSGGIKSKI